MDEKLARMSRNILQHISEMQIVTEDMMYEYTRECFTFVSEQKENFWSDGVKQLSEYLESVWRSGEYYEYTSKQAFEMGRLFALLDMLKMANDYKETNVRMDMDVLRLTSRKDIFQAIAEQNGITHKELARVVGISESSLSQFINKSELQIYVLYRKIGRTKYYYLTKSGAELLRRMQTNCRGKKEEDRLGQKTEIFKSRLRGEVKAVSVEKNDFVNSFVRDLDEPMIGTMIRDEEGKDELWEKMEALMQQSKKYMKC